MGWHPPPCLASFRSVACDSWAAYSENAGWVRSHLTVLAHALSSDGPTFGTGPHIRECGSTLYVGMAQGVSFSVYIGIGAKFENTQKTGERRLRTAEYRTVLL